MTSGAGTEDGPGVVALTGTPASVKARRTGPWIGISASLVPRRGCINRASVIDRLAYVGDVHTYRRVRRVDYHVAGGGQRPPDADALL